MTPEAQRVAIARACGWTPDPVNSRVNGREIWWFGPGENQTNAIFKHFSELPDYLSDLNAMNEAEKVLLDTPNAWPNYLAILGDIAVYPLTERATAAQRAKAFLRTLGLWREDAGEASSVMEHGTPRQFPKSDSLSSPAPTGSQEEEFGETGSHLPK